ncbi:MAG: hypothetical protein N2484_11705 [Clostridia bacterium]|nr:hypothetical protein [Clostridia bacterium]
MTFLLQKYKLQLIAVLFLLALVIATWMMTTKTKTNKVPSRGVFVMVQPEGNALV